MLKWNFKKLFKMRGIDNPFTFLRKLGVSHNLANRIANDQCDKIGLKHLALLCVILNCTPDDMMEWVPKGNVEPNSHKAVHALIPGKGGADAAELLRGIPAKQMKELAKMLRENSGSEKEGKG